MWYEIQSQKVSDYEAPVLQLVVQKGKVRKRWEKAFLDTLSHRLQLLDRAFVGIQVNLGRHIHVSASGRSLLPPGPVTDELRDGCLSLEVGKRVHVCLHPGFERVTSEQSHEVIEEEVIEEVPDGIVEIDEESGDVSSLSYVRGVLGDLIGEVPFQLVREGEDVFRDVAWVHVSLRELLHG